MLRAVVVDDEPLARRRLTRLLASNRGVHVVGEAGDGGAAAAVIASTRPDVAFLDVQMPAPDGVSVARALRPSRPLVVFVTAHDRYAVQAFDVRAVDYLLKPISRDRLVETLARVRQQLAQPHVWLQRLPVRSRGQVVIVDVTDIDWIESGGNYVVVHAAGRTHILRETLSHLEAALDPAAFLRIHRSAVVRLDRVARLDVALRGDYDVTLRDGTRVRLSRTQRGRLERALGREF